MNVAPRWAWLGSVLQCPHRGGVAMPHSIVAVEQGLRFLKSSHSSAPDLR